MTLSIDKMEYEATSTGIQHHLKSPDCNLLDKSPSTPSVVTTLLVAPEAPDAFNKSSVRGNPVFESPAVGPHQAPVSIVVARSAMRTQSIDQRPLARHDHFSLSSARRSASSETDILEPSQAQYIEVTTSQQKEKTSDLREVVSPCEAAYPLQDSTSRSGKVSSGEEVDGKWNVAPHLEVARYEKELPSRPREFHKVFTPLDCFAADARKESERRDGDNSPDLLDAYKTSARRDAFLPNSNSRSGNKDAQLASSQHRLVGSDSLNSTNLLIDSELPLSQPPSHSFAKHVSGSVLPQPMKARKLPGNIDSKQSPREPRTSQSRFVGRAEEKGGQEEIFCFFDQRWNSDSRSHIDLRTFCVVC